MSTTIAADIAALRAVPDRLQGSLDAMTRVDGDLDDALSWYWLRCGAYHLDVAYPSVTVGEHARKCARFHELFAMAADAIASAAAVGTEWRRGIDVPSIFRPRDEGMAALAAADAEAYLRENRRVRAIANRTHPAVTRRGEHERSSWYSVLLFSAEQRERMTVEEHADGTVDVTIVGERSLSAGPSVGDVLASLTVDGRPLLSAEVSASATALFEAVGGRTIRFATKADAARFVDAKQRVLDWDRYGEMPAGLASSWYERPIPPGGVLVGETSTTTLRGELAVDAVAESVGGGGASVGAATVAGEATMVHRRDRIRGTVSTMAAVGGELEGSIGTSAGAVAGLKGTEVVWEEDSGRPRELRVNTMAIEDDGERVTYVTRSLDLTQPEHRDVARLVELDAGASEASRQAGALVADDWYRRTPTSAIDWTHMTTERFALEDVEGFGVDALAAGMAVRTRDYRQIGRHVTSGPERRRAQVRR